MLEMQLGEKVNNSDINFAFNSLLTFYTDTEYFTGKKLMLKFNVQNYQTNKIKLVNLKN